MGSMMETEASGIGVSSSVTRVPSMLPRLAESVDPDYVKARQYLGEGYLAKGDVTRAKEQLDEIGKRCGGRCEEYTLLVDAIASHVAEEANPGW